MLKHHILIIYRSFKRFKSTFLINLIGLSIGLACVSLIYLWVNDELNFDKFHEKNDRLYQIISNHNNAGKIVTLEGTSDLLAETLTAEFPEVDNAAAVIPTSILGKFSIVVNDINYRTAGQFAGKDYFNIFSFNLLHGDKENILTNKNSVVISRQLAMKLFNTTENIIGKTLEWQLLGFKEQVTISGVYKDIPQNSSARFDFVLPYGAWKDLSLRFNRRFSWQANLPFTYFTLKEGADIEQFNKKAAGLVKRKNPNSNITLFTRKYSDGYLYGKYENGLLTGGRIEYVRVFSVIAIFILVIACINFMNLFTAKAGSRQKEVGIKKAIGADRRSLILQYMLESIVIAFISLLAAFLLVELFLPKFNEITGKDLALRFSAGTYLFFIVITLVTGILSGSYPALYLSHFNPVNIFKSKAGNLSGELWMRKGLVVLQFVLSIVFIISVIVVYRQVKFIQTKEPGYEKDNIIYFDKEGKAAENPEGFLEGVKKIPGIVNASIIGSTVIGSQNTTGGLGWEGKSPDDEVYFEEVCVGYDMLETLGIEMKEGRTFSREFGTDDSKIIFNEAAIKAMGLSEPLGKVVRHYTGAKEIVGVVKDFHFESLHEVVKPLLFRFVPNFTLKFMAKIEAGKEKQTINALQNFYKEYNPGFSFDFKFLDEDYQAQYEAEKRVEILSRYFAGLAIIISCLGLFGLTAYTAEQRKREIGIRKVLGAGTDSIVLLIAKDFIKLIIIAFIIASPAAWYITNNWLQDFAYRVDISVWIFIISGAAAMLVALATISYQAVKAAVADPVKSLRYE